MNITVIGPHRSGTSAVAGVLYHLGIHMGDDLIGPGHGNPTGHFEDRRLVELHDKIMGGLKDPVELHDRITGDWKDPQIDFEPHREAYTALIREREARFDLWGVKDPRLCYTFPYFAEIARDVHVISVGRDTEACAKSLFARGGHTWEEAYIISTCYLGRKFITLSNFSGSVLKVRYEYLVDCPEGVIMSIAAFVGVEPTDAAVAFIDPSLCHHRS